MNLEGYAHTNPSQFKTPTDWMYSVDERKPLFRFTMEMDFSDRLYFSTSVDIGVSSAHDNDPTDSTTTIGAFASGTVSLQQSAYRYQKYLLPNIPLSGSDNMLSDWPRESQLSLAGDWWSLTTGRGALNWGSGKTGNLVLGSHITNHNHLKASFFAEQVKLELLYLFLPNLTKETEQRLFLGHRLEAQPASWARIAITENVMYQGSTLTLAYLDPTYIYHNLYDSSHLNAIASLEVDLAIRPALSLHGQFALDQFQLPNETSSIANAMAALVNLSYSWEQKGFWTARAEVATTDPAMYRREGIDFLVARGLHNNGNPVIIDYLGYQYGSDSQVFALSLAYDNLTNLDLLLSTTLHRQGEVDYLTSHNTADDNNLQPNKKGPAPYGPIVKETLVVGLKGTYSPSWKERLSFYGQLDWIGRRTYTKATKSGSNHRSDLQLSLGCSLTF
ncbi:hypothetical protein SDC9_74387 [bioreactor metagenome]|uniref:Alginate export domain-containing protein n=1 Tax=bioreactor metagenome TaxID=1076179 RepID=A0A644YGY2_9ZZZZ